ncbi:MAG: DUF7151 family protein, partial [Myxococcota bacterium]
LAPRQRLVSAAFALRAGQAESAELADDSDRLGGVDAAEYALLSDLPGMCVTDAELQDVLAQEAYLDVGALAVYLTDSGYVPGPHFSGQFADLEGVPAALQKLSLTADGSLAFADTTIINAAGEWVGAATGLQGPPGQDGEDGAPGEQGPPGQNGQDGVPGEQGPPGQNGQDGAPGEQGPPGQNGQDGQEGPPGVQGETGEQGIQGVPGADGVSVLLTTAVEAEGSNCTVGGVKISSGADLNGNGVLDATEIQGVDYVCNGEAGADGAGGGDSTISGLALECQTVVESMSTSDKIVTCPEGWNMTGGGYFFGHVLPNYPSGNGWFCDGDPGTSGAACYARCCQVDGSEATVSGGGGAVSSGQLAMALDGLYLRTASAGSNQTVTARCDAVDDVVWTGGCDAHPGTVHISHPVDMLDSNVESGWECKPSGAPSTAFVYCIPGSALVSDE